MRHVCDKRCPIVREQLRKAREEAHEETPDEDSSSEGPSTGKRTKNGFSKRSRQSPTKTVGSAEASQHTLARGSPARSQRRSKGSERSRGDPSGRGETERSADPSRRFDRERGRYRKSHESELTVTERQTAVKKKTIASPISPRYDVEEYKIRGSRRSETVKRIPATAGGLKRAAEKGRRKRLEPDEDGRAGPSRRERKEDDEAFEMEADDYLPYKKLPYFGDLCSCCFRCVANQLWNDQFFKSTVASAAVFALGLKLCRDLKGWTLPNPL